MTKPTLMILTKKRAEGFPAIGNYSCQLAATVINPHYETHVIQIDPKISVDSLVSHVGEFTDNPVFAFSTIRNEDFPPFVELSSKLMKRGYIAFLAGAASEQRYIPEVGHEEHEHRFHGNLDSFDFCMRGPAEQAIKVLYRIENGMDYSSCEGVSMVEDGKLIRNPPKKANIDLLSEVDWSNLMDINGRPLKTETGVVLAQWGCPYSAGFSNTQIDPPYGVDFDEAYQLSSRGCTFCNYSDYLQGKIYTLRKEQIMHQISNLYANGITDFYLTHQNPFPILPGILESSNGQIERIHLLARVDYIVNHPKKIEDIVRQAKDKGVKLDMHCVGFESFTPRILSYFNKGSTVEDNYKAAEILIDLETRCEALEITHGPHGIIFPTPWHSLQELEDEAMLLSHDKRLIWFFDIFDRHLRISHTDFLADWVRFIEDKTGIEYKRNTCGNIEWHTKATRLWPNFPYGESIKVSDLVFK